MINRLLFKDEFVRNTAYVIMANLFNAGFGFVFWLVAANLYSKNEIGVATAILSSVSLVIIISRLGLEQCLIRYFPTGDKASILSTTVLVTTGFAIICVPGLLAIAALFTYDLGMPFNALVLYLFLVIVTSLVSVYGVALNAIRESRMFLWQNLVGGSKVGFLIIVIPLGAIGIFLSYAIAISLSLFICLYFFYRRGWLSLKMNRDFLRGKMWFSSSNYASTMLMTAPNSILPIIVLGELGPLAAADFYIAFTIASLLFMIPGATSTMLFVEGSYGENVRMNVVKTLKLSLALLGPALLGILIFGQWILGIIGKDYGGESFELLVLLSISSIFLTIFQTFISVKKIEEDTHSLVYYGGLQFLLLISISFLMINYYGINGVGYAWILSQALLASIILFTWHKSSKKGFNSLGKDGFLKRLPEKPGHQND